MTTKYGASSCKTRSIEAKSTDRERKIITTPLSYNVPSLETK